jgi:hypothetical protein
MTRCGAATPCSAARSAPEEISYGRVVVNQNDSEVYVEQYNKTDEYRTVLVPGPVMEALTAHIATYCPGEDRERFLFLTRNMTHSLRRNLGRDVSRPARRRPPTVIFGSPCCRCGTRLRP